MRYIKLALSMMLVVIFSYSVTAGTCFPAGTQVTMANGSKKPIENVNLGEEVVGYQGKTHTVEGFERPIVGNRTTFVINDKVEVTGDHPFLGVDGMWRVPDLSLYMSFNKSHNFTPVQLEIGDYLYTKDGIEMVREIEERNVRSYNETLYDLLVSGDSTYNAEDFIVHNCCFLKNAPVNMANGSYKPIQDVKIGDKVKVYDRKSGTIKSAKVQNLQKKLHYNVHKLHLANGKVLKPTANHPFMTLQKGWATIDGLDDMNIGAGQLKEGDHVLSITNKKKEYVEVEKIVPMQGPYTTYNFLDMKYGTFLVENIVTHNSGGGGGSCFPADTQINMSEGSKPIQEIEVGDMVKSYNTKTNEYVDKEVTALDFDYTVGSHAEACESLGDAPSLYTINGLIEFTPEHPFYVRDNGTKWAALVPYENQHPGKTHELKEGQKILVNNTWIEIENISVARCDVPDVRVYNFEVEDTNTYIANGFVVHNKDTSTSSGSTEPSFQECINQDKDCEETFSSPETVDINGQQVTIEGDASTDNGKVSADKLKTEGVVHENIKNFDVENGKAGYEKVGNMHATVPGPKKHESPAQEGYQILKGKDNSLTHRGASETVNELIDKTKNHPKVNGEDLVSYLQDNYPDALEQDPVKNELNQSFNITMNQPDSTDKISSPPQEGAIQAEDVSTSEVVYEDGEIKDITFTSTKDDNNITFNGVRAVLDSGESASITKNSNDKYEIETTENATVQDGSLSTSYIEIAPGSRYDFVGRGSQKFAVYIPSDASAFKLYIRTLDSEPSTLSCSQCGLIDFVNYNATLFGNYEFEKPSSSLPVFTNIIEAEGKFSFGLDNTATNLTRLYPSINRVFTGDFEVVFDRQGYSFNDGAKPYVIEKINPAINITNKTLKRTEPRNVLKMYPENSGGFYKQWQEVIYE